MARYNANRVDMNVPVPARAMDLETEAREERLVKRLWFWGRVDWKERDGGLSADFADCVCCCDDFVIDERKARKRGDDAFVWDEDHLMGMVDVSVCEDIEFGFCKIIQFSL